MAGKTGAEVARAHGIDPKEFRRFLRAVPSWNNPGTGKRYVFGERDEAAAVKGFAGWKAARQPVVKPKKIEG